MIVKIDVSYVGEVQCKTNPLYSCFHSFGVISLCCYVFIFNFCLNPGAKSISSSTKMADSVTKQTSGSINQLLYWVLLQHVADIEHESFFKTEYNIN